MEFRSRRRTKLRSSLDHKKDKETANGNGVEVAQDCSLIGNDGGTLHGYAAGESVVVWDVLGFRGL